MEYKFTEIEDKWKKIWAEKEVYKVTEDSSKPKYYVLDMFPYPSGAGLHVGHPLGYVASDIYARYKRMKGYNVLHPMGYDAFGLPAEQYAIETGTHPAETTAKAIKRYREQLDKIGFSFDWSREVKTCDPDYYKWTQWIFLKLFNSWYNKEANKAEPIETLIEKLKSGDSKFEIRNSRFEIVSWNDLSDIEQQNVLMNYRLAYLSFAEVNWCEALGCVLANDEVKDGKSERGGYPVEKRKMRQWFLRITEYSDRLLEGLEKLDWSEAMKDMQRNWIGRSEGALIQFSIFNFQFSIEVFTTRPDTIFGATFMVIAPEHELVETLTTPEQKEAIDKYIAYVKSRSDVERQQEKKVTGEFTGSYAVNPFTGKNIPVYIAEYVLAGYGTGAIMAVPADDERDRKFAEKFGLSIVDIIDKSMYPGATIEDKVGKMINSDFLNGMEVKDAISRIIDEIEKRGIGKRKVNYKQRDAIYSRQRYWGEPIPIRYKHIGAPDLPFGESDDIPMPLSESELPLVLPDVTSFKPAGDGRSPLANNAEWIKNGYETDTMPGYAGSSWYFLRYMDPHNNEAFAAKDKLNYWQNVDIYFGGAEHAVGHLLYSRMWHKVLFDLGYLPTDEPFKKMVNQGMIQGRSAYCYVTNADKIITEKLHNLGYFPRVFISRNKAKEFTVNGVFTKAGLASVYQAFEEMTKCKVNSVENLRLSTLPIDVSLVEEDELNWEAFKSLSEDRKEAKYVLEEDGKFYVEREVEKMSKSKYNVVNPDDVIAKYGADCFRMFEMFLGPIEQSKPWDDKGISGVSNFLRKFWRLFYSSQTLPEGEQPPVLDKSEPTKEEYKILHGTLKKLESDIERLNFNTCISALMIAVNELTSLNCHKREILQPLVIAIAPFAPFIAEELWEKLGNSGSVHHQSFPKVEEKYLVESSHKYPVSINGKVRAEVELPLDITPEVAEQQVLSLDAVKKWTNGNPPKKFIFVKGRIVNVVV
ncbi:MAG: leucine--tRNA ligase [Chitinophagales bacterium]|nr:leucine--tRNA ligase [Chitinophagales bacterium]